MSIKGKLKPKDEWGERSLVDWIRRRSAKSAPSGPGDDCAIVSASRDQDLVISTDNLVEGIHFLLEKQTVRQIGHKAAARSLSDVAAMGVQPSRLLLAMAIPSKVGQNQQKELFKAVQRCCRRFSVDIIGGDISRSPDRLMLNTTAMGYCPKGSAVLRSGARPGDRVWVTGCLGGASLGKHLRFIPRVQEACMLRKHFSPTAMIDLSDGLSNDLARICDDSQVGAEIYRGRIPVSPAARLLSKGGRSTPVEHAMNDGEDFELLFTLSEKESARLERSNRFRARMTWIGFITAEKEVWLTDKSGRTRFVAKGYEHTI